MYKEDILRILKNANSYISGEAIRKELGISRMAVSKNISQLREAGYEIDSCTNKGYQLNHYSPRYDYTELASCLPKEIELLKLLLEHKGLVLTRSQILDELWGYDAPIIDRTVDTYIKNLRKKLNLDRIITVKGVGYKYEESL